MSRLPQDFWDRALLAVQAIDRMPDLAAAVQAEVEGFYARHPGLVRTRVGEAFLASLVIDRLSAGATSAPAAPQTPTQTQNAA